jgi:hypothetical protein
MKLEPTEAASPPAEPGSSIRLSLTLCLIALALGLLVEILFYGHRPGISLFMWAAACVLAAAAAGSLARVRVSTSAWLAVAGVLVFAGATFFRQEPLTVLLCLILTVFLLTVVVRAFRFGRLGRFGWVDMAVAFLWVPLETWICPWPVAAEAWSGTVRGVKPAGGVFCRGLLLALPSRSSSWLC